MKIERYIIVKDNEFVVRNRKPGGYGFIPISDPELLDKAYLFKSSDAAKVSLDGMNDGYYKVVKLLGNVKCCDVTYERKTRVNCNEN